MHNIAVIGASGAVGGALTGVLAKHYPQARIHAFSRCVPACSAVNVVFHTLDYEDEAAIEAAAQMAARDAPLDLVLVATGMLHEAELLPEKSLRDLSAHKFQRLFAVNTILPALLAKHFVPMLHRDRRAVFAALSARVGSISDNQLGGWYAYRASKAALNMVIKNVAIEAARRNPQAIIAGLHPGTVDSALSEPFQGNVAPGKLFTAAHSAQCLLQVLIDLSPEQSGKCFAWDGSEIEP